MKTFIFFALLGLFLASCGRPSADNYVVSCNSVGVCDTMHLNLPYYDGGELDKVWQSDLTSSQLDWFMDRADWSTAGFTCKKKYVGVRRF